MELERILHRHGFGTRKGCRTIIRQGRVSILGQVVNDPFRELHTDGLSFTVDGVEWPFMASATVMLHKPSGYECSRKPQHHPSVLELLPVPLRMRDVQPIGRLDEDTTGLILLTDDGQLNHVLSSARRKVPKVYEAVTRHPVTDDQVDQLLAGVLLHDEPAPLAAATAARVGDNLLRLTLTEGKYHQVKRMVAAVGNRVDRLHRVAIGDLVLPADLAPGQWRWLTTTDLKILGYTS